MVHPPVHPDRCRTQFIDSVLMQQAPAPPPGSSPGTSPWGAEGTSGGASGGGRRMLRRVDEQVADIRKNVKDAAEAVAIWTAAVVNHDEPQTNLNDVLNDCLRPGHDPCDVNYTAIARHINDTLNTNLSPKRIQSAINLLRQKREGKLAMPRPDLYQQLQALTAQLQENHQALLATSLDQTQRDGMCRQIATDILAAVRVGAGRLIENDFGEGIAQDLDIDEIEGSFLDFVRDVVNEQGIGPIAGTLAADLQNLLIDLCDYDGSAPCDMRIVVHGARVVSDLTGPDSITGLTAQLNVLVAGRHLLDSALYTTEMFRLATEAYALRSDPATQKYLTWMRRQPADSRLPSPVRLSSYCLNNAATHLYEQIFPPPTPGSVLESTTESDPISRNIPINSASEPANDSLTQADHALKQMRQQDSGFELIAVTTLIQQTITAQQTDSDKAIIDHLHQLGHARTLDVLEKLIRFDNCRPLIDAAKAHAHTAFPGITRELIDIG